MAWTIDVDHLAEPDAPAGSNRNAKGMTGPHNAIIREDWLKHKFRMLDDDREVYYEGRSDNYAGFGPLDDFGMPNAGCTIIQYMENGAWRDI